MVVPQGMDSMTIEQANIAFTLVSCAVGIGMVALLLTGCLVLLDYYKDHKNG